jgi:hypothetical protein
MKYLQLLDGRVLLRHWSKWYIVYPMDKPKKFNIKGDK